MAERIDQPSTDVSRSPARASARTLAAAAPAALLLVVVALASAGNPLSLPLRVGFVDRRELIVLSAAVALSVMAAAFVVAWLVQRTVSRTADGSGLSHALLRVAPVAAAIAGIACLAAIARVQMQVEQQVRATSRMESPGARPGVPLGMTEERMTPVVAGEGEEEEEGDVVPAERVAARTPFVRLLLGAVLVALLFLAGAAWLTHRIRPRVIRADNAEDDDVAVHSALVASIEAMLVDPDPRTAVIGAYARLLENLADCGYARRAHEAPLEHLRRTFQRANVRAEPIHELIELFERARFSSHRILPADRERALRALHDAAADIAPLAGHSATGAA